MQSKRGIDNLWAIFDLLPEDRKKCESIITNDIVSEVFNELFSDKRPTGNQSIWTYLLRYERHSFYPKNTKGYFYDYIHVACNWLRKQEQKEDVAKETELYAEIEECSKNDFKTLSDVAIGSKLSPLTDEGAGCKFAIAAPLFLLMKDKFSDGFYIDRSTIDYAKKFGFECFIAVYLLGITLGYDKTYDAYYDFIELTIFNGQTSIAKGEFSNQNGLCTIPKQQDLFCNEQKADNNDKQLPVAWLGKEERKMVYKPAFNEGDIMRLLKDGYKVYNRYSSILSTYIAHQGYESPRREEIDYIYRKYGDKK